MEQTRHLALPLKYRPMTFDDVIGQEHVVKTLRNALAAGRIANAYLFIGPRGIGKTTLSRIFAKAANCKSPAGVEPCGKCDNCLEIAAGRSLDVVELDAASHNKVEDVARIVESVEFKPASSKYKVFIIDECHMLSKNAWNALLKTLEEPPPYVRFVFATTEGDKVIPTIVSRCHRFDLRRIQTNDIVSRLEYICSREGISAGRDALLAIARGAEGGMRDALSTLDQLASTSNDNVTEDDVLSMFGLVSRSALESLADAVLAGDAAAILSAVETFDSAGKDMRRLAAELLLHFRNLVVVQAAGTNVKSLEATPEQIETLVRQAAMADPGRVFRICDQFSELDEKLRKSLSPRTILEMTLMRAGRIATTATIDELMKAVRELRAAGIVGDSGAGVTSERPPPAKPEPAPAVKPASFVREEPVAHAVQPAPAPSVAPKPPVPEKSAAKPSFAGRRATLEDPKINNILAMFPGAKIADIKE